MVFKDSGGLWRLGQLACAHRPEGASLRAVGQKSSVQDEPVHPARSIFRPFILLPFGKET